MSNGLLKMSPVGLQRALVSTRHAVIGLGHSQGCVAASNMVDTARTDQLSVAPSNNANRAVSAALAVGLLSDVSSVLNVAL